MNLPAFAVEVPRTEGFYCLDPYRSRKNRNVESTLLSSMLRRLLQSTSYPI